MSRSTGASHGKAALVLPVDWFEPRKPSSTESKPVVRVLDGTAVERQHHLDLNGANAVLTRKQHAVRSTAM